MFDAIFMIDDDGCERGFARLHPTALCSGADVERAFTEASAPLWIARHASVSAWLGRAMVSRVQPRRGCVLVLEELGAGALAMLNALFERVVAPPASLLSVEELVEVFRSEQGPDLCIGGIVDPVAGVVTLYRGDLRSITAPLSLFPPTPEGLVPDPSAFSVTDYGRTLVFGEYEAAFDVVLYERDPEYRRRLAAQRRAEDQGFGASVRRLRLQRGLRQNDIAGVTSKTVARIERDEVSRPHAGTLIKLATAFGVPVEELGAF